MEGSGSGEDMGGVEGEEIIIICCLLKHLFSIKKKQYRLLILKYICMYTWYTIHIWDEKV